MKSNTQILLRKQVYLKAISVAALLSASLYVQAASLDVDITSQPLDQAINSLAKQSGESIAFSTAITEKLKAPTIKGKYSTQQALDLLLEGSGLSAQKVNGGYSIIKSAEPKPDTLPEVSVRGNKDNGSGVIDSPPAYAGGQVARGGKVGLLGNKDFLDTPFSQTSYTAEHIQNTQSRTIAEVLESSPSVRRVSGRFMQNDSFKIRGYDVNGYDMSYDGMFGLTSVRRNAIEAIERVELLKGPSALLNGVPPTGAIGGSINLVPKRALNNDNTDVTLGYLTDSNFSAQADVGRRFGDEKQFGVRVNALQRGGDTALDYNSERMTLASIALDYRGEKLRLFANINYEKQRADAPGFSIWTLANSLPSVPGAPDARTNANPSFVFTKTERNFNVVRGEYDLNDNWTASLGYGWQNNRETQFVAYGRQILNLRGDVTAPTTYRMSVGDRYNDTINAGLNGKFDTGPIKHQVALQGYSMFQQWKFGTSFAPATVAPSNIYDMSENYPEPSFANSTVAHSISELTTQGIALSDTLSAFDDRAQLTLGARRQTIKTVNPLATGDKTLYDESATTPAVAVLVKPWDKVSLYANYIEALTQGPSLPTGVANPIDQVFAPMKSKQKEVGIKVDFGRIASTLALFEITKPSGITNVVTNIFSVDGEQRNRGVELETFGEIVPNVRVLGGVTYIDSELTKTQGRVDQGNEAPGIAKWNVSVGSEWDVPFVSNLTLTGRVLYNGPQYLDNANRWEVPSWTRVDIGGRYLIKSGHYPVTIRANITNLFNRDYWENGLVLGPPRMGFVSATVNF